MTETLDRDPDGFPSKCSECGRSYKGQAWMDYCAECNAENEKNSPLRHRWACLTCSSTFEAGTIRSGPQGWQCPKCKSNDIGPAEGTRELPEYFGDIPEQKQ